ncbi:hypothetical protein HK096_006851, partial [Nowakowskiella sp. JEL0078]
MLRFIKSLNINVFYLECGTVLAGACAIAVSASLQRGFVDEFGFCDYKHHWVSLIPAILRFIVELTVVFYMYKYNDKIQKAMGSEIG